MSDELSSLLLFTIGLLIVIFLNDVLGSGAFEDSPTHGTQLFDSGFQVSKKARLSFNATNSEGVLPCSFLPR